MWLSTHLYSDDAVLSLHDSAGRPEPLPGVSDGIKLPNLHSALPSSLLSATFAFTLYTQALHTRPGCSKYSCLAIIKANFTSRYIMIVRCICRKQQGATLPSTM